MKFHGSFDELKRHVEYIARQGDWSGDDTKWCFRSKTGEILNWWPKTGTLQPQGQNSDKLQADLAKSFGSSEAFKNSARGQRRIFIVHGSDTEALDQLQLVLYKLNLQPLVQKDVD